MLQIYFCDIRTTGLLFRAWDAAAKLIWTSDLNADNTLLCKTTVTGP